MEKIDIAIAASSFLVLPLAQSLAPQLKRALQKQNSVSNTQHRNSRRNPKMSIYEIVQEVHSESELMKEQDLPEIYYIEYTLSHDL